MKRVLLILGAAAAAGTTMSCGDNSNECGPGTEAVDGLCVATGDGTCGEGTTLVDGECLPVCEQGTVYDADAGGCVPSDEVCGPGTVLLDGECVPEGTIVTQHQEEAEPNDFLLEEDGFAGMFDVPEIGAAGATFSGCITPYRDYTGDGVDDIDYDAWVIQTEGPALIDVTADGVAGLSAGFFLLPGTPGLGEAGWQRIGASLVSDTASRQVYLAEAGLYVMFMTDSRSIFFPDQPAAGSEETCYYVTVANVDVPAPTPLTEYTEDEIGGDTHFYSYDPSACELSEFFHDVASSSAVGSVLALRNGGVFAYSEAPVDIFTGGLGDDDEVLLVVEPTYNYAVAPVLYYLEPASIAGAALPEDGSALSITNGNTTYPFALEDLTWACVDVGADEVVHFDLAMENESHLVFADTDLLVVSDVTGLLGLPSLIDGFSDWVRFPGPGRYCAVFWNEDVAEGDTWDVTSTVTHVTPTAFTVGTPVEDAQFNDLGAAWYSVDPADLDWLSYTAGATGFDGDVAVDLYYDDAVGIPDFDFDATGGASLDADGTDLAGRVSYADAADYLVRVTDGDGGAGAEATYDLSFDQRVFIDLGTVTEDAPINEIDQPIDVVGSSVLYLVRAQAGDEMTVTVTPGDFDASIQWLDRNEVVLENVDGSPLPTGAETLETGLLEEGWVAFRVTNDLGLESTFEIDITVVSRGYTVTDGTTAYADVCGDANAVDILPGNPDDGLSAVQNLPFAFDLHGDDTGGDFVVSTNGSVQFGASSATFTNAAIPSATDPDGFIAPYWDDLFLAELCVLDEGTDATTVQFVGELFSDGSPVEFQVRINADGSFELIYGPGHGPTGTSATIGSENLAANFGVQVGFNQAGTVEAGSSLLFTP